MNRLFILLTLIALVIVTGRGVPASPASAGLPLPAPGHPAAAPLPAEPPASAAEPISTPREWVTDAHDCPADSLELSLKRWGRGDLLP